MGNYMNVVANNIPGMYTSRQLGLVRTDKGKSAEKLSSGYKINRAADDAAGLTISENMRRMIRGLTQASLNVQDGVSLCQVADGYLDEVHDMLHRLTELSVKGSNGTLTDEDRQAINDEVNALKKEMKRIFNVANFNEIPLFHVPYTPEISTPPDNMELFHIGTGGVGGLEFNNVRYSIEELQGKGFLIDSNGIATGDFEASFDLWDGETVDISMKEGDRLADAKRNYKWSVDETGISINNKLAARWQDVTGPDGNPVTDISVFQTGTYRFTHQGMNISFDIDEEADFDDVIAGINGDAATKPATWDVSVGGAINKPAVSITSPSRQINVSSANKDFIDHTFAVMANENGIAIKDKTTGYTTASRNWNTFSGRNGEYPIRNWGEGTDGNGESDMTFDDTATYTYSASDSNVPKFVFDFQLAESASLTEVEYAMNDRNMSSSKVMAPGDLTAESTTSYGSISLNGGNSLINDEGDTGSGDFALQRAYGRNFDDPSVPLVASIKVSRTAVGDNPANDVPDGTGGYVSGHTVDEANRRLIDPGSEVSTGKYNQTYTIYYNEQFGIYQKYTTYLEDFKCTEKSMVKDRWSRGAEYTFSGSMNSHVMKSVTMSQTETFERELTQTRERTRTQTVTAYVGPVGEDKLTDEEKANAIHVTSSGYLPQSGSQTIGGYTYGEYTTTKISTATLIGIDKNNFNDIAFKTSEDNITGSKNAFSFNYSLTTAQAKTLASGSGEKNAGTVTFTARGVATRTFLPNTYGNINEAEFSNVMLNVPKKQLDIQAGANAGDIIRMEWSPLNLTILGISGANTLTQESSRAAIGMVQNALNVISETRSAFGAYQNRFEHTIMNLDNIVENTQAAESLIRDTDMAKEMVRYAKDNILEQAGTSMLVQSNQSKQWIISLLNS